MPHPAAADELVDGEKRLLERNLGVVDVQVEQVDPIGAQATQRRVDGRRDRRGGEARMFGALADFRRDHEVVAVAALAHPGADHGLATTRGVGVGGVDEVAAPVGVAVEDRASGRRVRGPAEDIAAQGEREDVEVGIAESAT